MHEITEKQRLVYDCIKESIKTYGYPPTVRELSNKLGISSSATQARLRKLEEAGYLKRDPAKPRTLEIVNEDIKAVTVINAPILDIIDSDSLFSNRNIKGYLPIPTNIIDFKEIFLFQVKDNSMINAHILEGDMIIVNVEPTAEDGDIVLILLDAAVMVRRYFKDKGHYRLQPENDIMEPIIVDHVKILGKIIGVFRLDIR
uniref:transcriptional repressor LexA n=1 Tax=Clostridium sp. 12(A) TaxID=1163671 RepID=UPI00054ED877|nr:transcriptional repressor LexA [Clostridium sp. 12(A)]